MVIDLFNNAEKINSGRYEEKLHSVKKPIKQKRKIIEIENISDEEF